MLSGLPSIFTISIMWIHFFFDFILPTTSVTYYLIKDFVTNLVLFIGVPLTIVTGHDNMEQYIRQHVTDNSLFKFVLWTQSKLTRRNLTRFVIWTQNEFSTFVIKLQSMTTNSLTPVQNLQSVTVVNNALQSGSNSISPFPNLMDDRYKNNPDRVLYI